MDLANLIQEHINFIKFVEDKSPNTIKQRMSSLSLYVRMTGAVLLCDITNQQINNWIAVRRSEAMRIGRELKGQTLNDNLGHLKAFLQWCEDNGYNHSVKYRIIPRLKESAPRQNYYSREVISKALLRSSEVEKLTILILFDTCMRRTELATLKVGDIQGRKITYVGKGRKLSVAYLDPSTSDMVHNYMGGKSPDDWLFPSSMNKGMHINPNTVNRRVQRPFERIGIYDAHTHAMKHSAGTDLEIRGAPMKLISELLHHTKISTTQIYTHAVKENLLTMRDSYKLA